MKLTRGAKIAIVVSVSAALMGAAVTSSYAGQQSKPCPCPVQQDAGSDINAK